MAGQLPSGRQLLPNPITSELPVNRRPPEPMGAWKAVNDRIGLKLGATRTALPPGKLKSVEFLTGGRDGCVRTNGISSGLLHLLSLRVHRRELSYLPKIRRH